MNKNIFKSYFLGTLKKLLFSAWTRPYSFTPFACPDNIGVTMDADPTLNQVKDSNKSNKQSERPNILIGMR